MVFKLSTNEKMLILTRNLFTAYYIRVLFSWTNSYLKKKPFLSPQNSRIRSHRICNLPVMNYTGIDTSRWLIVMSRHLHPSVRTWCVIVGQRIGIRDWESMNPWYYWILVLMCYFPRSYWICGLLRFTLYFWEE